MLIAEAGFLVHFVSGAFYGLWKRNMRNLGQVSIE
jgi:hypothetical protein